MPEKASMTSTLSRPRSRTARRTPPFSVTISSRACSRAPASPRTSKSSKNSLPGMTSAPFAITGGRAATGNCCPGFLAARPRTREPRPRQAHFQRSAAGKCWTICVERSRRPAAVLALLVGWTLPLHVALIWTLFVVLTIALPTLIPVVAAIPPRRPGVTMSSHLRALGGDLRLALTLSALTVVFLADQAWLMADAIGRTLWRLGVSRRHLLEWVPAAQATIGPRLDLLGFARRMAGAIVIGGAAAIVALTSRHGILAAGASLRRALARFAGRRPFCQPVSWRGRSSADGPTPMRRR